MSEVKLTNQNFESEVLKSDKMVLVDFYANWCGPCQMIAPILSEIAEEHSGKLKVGKINVDEERELASQYQVSSIPTLLLFKEGKIVKALVGFRSKSEIRAFATTNTFIVIY